MGRAAGPAGWDAEDSRGHRPHRRRRATPSGLPRDRRAGARRWKPDAKTAQKELDRRPASHTYVITVSYLAPDERPDLAADDRLTDADVDAITARPDRWDAAAEKPWTREYLEMINANEAVRAPDLATRVGLDVPRFKRRVRQLKGTRPHDQPRCGLSTVAARQGFLRV
jgi:hypothetical protein